MIATKFRGQNGHLCMYYLFELENRAILIQDKTHSYIPHGLHPSLKYTIKIQRYIHHEVIVPVQIFGPRH